MFELYVTMQGTYDFCGALFIRRDFHHMLIIFPHVHV